jgi:hypothetical protein
MMGGGGGGKFFQTDPKELADKLRRLEQDTEDQAFKSEVEAMLGQVLADANDRDVNLVADCLAEIQEALGNNVGGLVDLLFGGSVAKHTYVEGMSDVDALVIVNDSDLVSLDPKSVCEFLLKKLSDGLDAKVTADGFAITAQFKNIQVQVIPVIRKGDDYLLPNAEATSWSRVRPTAFTDVLTAANKAASGKLIPTVKLAKVLLGELPEDRRPSGYHLENLAVKAFASYDGPCTPREMLRHFFDKAPDLIRNPIPDKTGQSKNVDDNLGPKDSVNRLIVADAVSRIGRKLRNADGAQDIDQWKRLVGVDQ